jgi:hypothetical protein
MEWTACYENTERLYIAAQYSEYDTYSKVFGVISFLHTESPVCPVIGTSHLSSSMGILCALSCIRCGFLHMQKKANHNGRALWGTNCLRLLERWDHRFESHSKNGCLYFVRLFRVYVVLCVGSGLETGWSLVQGVLPTVCSIKKLKKRPRSTRAVEP